MARKQLHLIEAGSAEVDEGRLFTPSLNEGHWIRVPIPVFLIETAESLVLIDTGVNEIVRTDPTYTVRKRPIEPFIRPSLTEAQFLPRSLEARGFDLQDISVVVNTHLHWDHAGNNRLFQNTPIIVQESHFQHALDKPAFYPEFWQHDLQYELVNGETEAAPGVRLLPAGGHVPGFQAVLIEGSKSGGVILCGDAINCEANLSLRLFSSDFNYDAEEARKSALELEALASRTNSQMIYGHDARQWPTLKSPLMVE